MQWHAWVNRPEIENSINALRSKSNRPSMDGCCPNIRSLMTTFAAMFPNIWCAVCDERWAMFSYCPNIESAQNDRNIFQCDVRCPTEENKIIQWIIIWWNREFLMLIRTCSMDVAVLYFSSSNFSSFASSKFLIGSIAVKCFCEYGTDKKMQCKDAIGESATLWNNFPYP